MKTYRVILILLVLGLPFAHATSIQDIQVKKGNSWSLGENLFAGNTYDYEICDYKLERDNINPCYVLSLQVIALLDTPNGQEWIMQGVIVSEDNYSFVINVSENFTVKTDAISTPYGKSIERTIFDMHKYANKTSPQYLNINAIWGSIDSYYGEKKDVEVRGYNENKIIPGTLEKGLYEIGYFVKEVSTIEINEKFAFPINAEIYSTIQIQPNVKILYSYSLIDYNAKIERINGNFCSINNSTSNQLLLDEIRVVEKPNNTENTIPEIKIDNEIAYESESINYEDDLERFLVEFFANLE